MNLSDEARKISLILSVCAITSTKIVADFLQDAAFAETIFLQHGSLKPPDLLRSNYFAPHEFAAFSCGCFPSPAPSSTWRWMNLNSSQIRYHSACFILSS
jgi:hypothetical protein